MTPNQQTDREAMIEVVSIAVVTKRAVFIANGVLNQFVSAPRTHSHRRQPIIRLIRRLVIPRLRLAVILGDGHFAFSKSHGL